MKKTFFVAVICYIILTLAAGLSFYLILIISKENWFLAVIAAFICIIAILALLWYALKYTFALKSFRQMRARFELKTAKTTLTADELPKALEANCPLKEYKSISGQKDGVSYKLFMKLNEASSLPDFLYVRAKRGFDPLFLSNSIDQILLIHDAPSSLFKTIVIISAPRSGNEERNAYLLNSAYGLSKRRFCCLFEEKMSLAYICCEKTFLTTDFITDSFSEINKLLHIGKLS